MRGKERSYPLKHSTLQNALKARLQDFKREHLWKPRISPTSMVLQSFVLSQHTHTLHTIAEQQETNPGIMDPVDIIASLRHTSQVNRFEVYVVEVKPKEDYTEMSSRFCYTHYDEVPDKVSFTDPVGRETEIVFLKHDRKIYMGGWKQLAEFYGLYLGGHMTLTYVGLGRFFIQVFNNYGSQVVYPPLHYGNSLGMFHYGSPMIPTPLGPQPLMAHPTTAMKGPCVNAKLIYQANVRAANQAITGVFQTPVPNFPGANAVQHHEGVSDNVVAASRVGGSGVPKEFYLMYLKTIMPVDMERNAMVLPKKFAALALPLESSDVKLVDSDGTKWPCYIHWETGSQYYCTLTRGWSKFRAMKGFKIGDQILFAVSERNSDVLCFVENCKELPRHHQFW